MRILLVTTRFPLPAWRGQQVRAIEWLKALGDHRRICVCPRPETAESAQNPDLGQVRFVTYKDSKLGRVGAALTGSGLGPMPLQEGMYATGAAKAAVLEAIRAEPPDLVIIQMVRCAWAAELIKREAPGTPILFDAIDAMGLHFSRAADTFNPVLRPFVRLEAVRCRRREQFLASLVESLHFCGNGHLIPCLVGVLSCFPRESRTAGIVLLRGSGRRPVLLDCGPQHREPVFRFSSFDPRNLHLNFFKRQK